MTAARWAEIKAGAKPEPHEHVQIANLRSWERRSAAARRGVATKLAKYTVWPDRRNLHRERV